MNRTTAALRRELGAAQEEVSRLRRQLHDLQSARESPAFGDNSGPMRRAVKTELLANISHEIRTPISAILGMTELTLGTELGEHQRQHLTLAKQSAEALLRLLNDVLDFSKIEAGRMDLEVVDFNLASLMGDTMKALAVRAGQKGLELVWFLAPTVSEHVVGDPSRLRQVLVNLVDNALKFTQRGEIVVRVEPEWQTETEAALRFSVTDTGIGIPADRLESIFDAFRQAESSTNRRFGGTGLGLTIASQLIELMGGQIWVRSDAGKGSTFFFCVRLRLQTQPKPHFPTLDLRQLAGKSVLIVDHHQTNCRILQQYVQRWGMGCSAVATAADALAELARAEAAGRPFHLVLSALALPDMDEFELAARVAQHSGTATPLVLMLSAAHGQDETARRRQSGVAAWLTKPVAPAELRDAMLRALAAHGANGGVAATSRSSIRTQPCARPAAKAQRRMRVLVADDSTANRVLTSKILQQRGHEVLAVGSGQEALDALEHQPFDVVLMDVQMPEIDGFAATAAIRCREQQIGGHVPIIALTAHAMPGDRERCLAAGMDAYLAKPIRASDLEAAVESLGAAPALGGSPASTRSAGGEFDFEPALTRLRGDAGLLKEQMNFFLIDAPDLLADIQTTIDSGDAKALEFAAHRMKSLVGNFDATAAEQCALELEQMGRQGSLGDAQATCEELVAQVNRLRQALQQFVATH